MARRWMLAAAAALVCAACASARRDVAIPAGWMTVPEAARIRALSYAGGILVHEPPAAVRGPVRIVKVGEGVVLANGEKTLTPPFAAIDSFDVSSERREIVFSARRGSSFDVGLVSLDGSEVHWVPSDPADETAVQWAPPGNKISYLVHAHGGDLVRTVHVASAVQLSVGFPDGEVHAVAWNPQGDRFAVAWSSLDASDRVEEMTYAGEDRRMLTPPERRLDVEAGPVGGVVVLRPAAMRYNEKLPLVVWRASSPHEWDDARARLEREARVACAVVDGVPSQAFWTAVAAVPWIDMRRVFVVGEAGPPGSTVVLGSAEIAAGTMRREGNIVRVAPALVKSFAAGMIVEQLKGNPLPNGIDR